MLLVPSAASADWWSEHFSVHGWMRSTLYARSPGFDVGNELKTSSWQTELNLEPELQIYEGDDVDVSFYGVFRPTYDAVYQIHPHTWGKRADGGDFGSGPADLTDPLTGNDFSSDVINGREFSSHFGVGFAAARAASGLSPFDPIEARSGNCVKGEICLANSDLGSLFIADSDPTSMVSPFALADPEVFTATYQQVNKEKRQPAALIDDTVFFGRIPALVLPPGSRQDEIGGNASLATFRDFQNSSARLLFGFDALAGALAAMGDPNAVSNAAGALALGDAALRRSLNQLAGTETLGLAPGDAVDAAIPLNFFAGGGLGDRSSLNEQAPADINRSQSRLQWDCFDNAHPWCFVREAYLDLRFGDVLGDKLSLRIGRQQIVWGKTDVFRLQDNLMPIDFGQHSILPSLEDRRIPQLALDAVYRLGDVGPLRDFSVELAWIFDRFRPAQFGQCGEPYAFTAACEARADAGGHQLFNVALAGVKEVPWKLSNTEPGLRLEFRLPRPSVAVSLSAFWGRQDLPVIKFQNRYSVDNPNSAFMLFIQGVGFGGAIDGAVTGADPLSVDCDAAGASLAHPWLCGFDPLARVAGSAQPSGSLAAANQQLQAFWSGTIAATCGGLEGRALGECANPNLLFATPWAASEAQLQYPRVLRLGGSADYQIPQTDTIARLELAYDVDRHINDTSEPDGVGSSDVFLASLGLDRPTFIPFVNPGRTAFLSFQTFVEHVMDHEEKGTGGGFVVPDTTVVSTFLMQNFWRSDSLSLTSVAAYDWQSQAWLFAPKFHWVINQNWLLDVGVNVFWGAGNDQEQNIRDMCPGGELTFACVSDPSRWNAGQWQGLNQDLSRTARAPWWNRQGFADQFAEDRDEAWIRFTYQF